MNNSPAVVSPSSFGPISLLPALTGSGPAMRWLLALAGVVLLARPVRAQYSDLDIGVRSEIVDKPFGKLDPKDWPVHSKVYGILPPQQIASQDKLVKSVDPKWLAALVVHELDTIGFQQAVKGQKPDIVITVLFGRGWLRNPYMAGSGPETAGGASSVPGIDSPSVTITGIPTQLFKEKGTGFEAKLQKAQYEKLCIRLTAWQYPTDPKAKPKQLWNTTMVLDDPDHRDLNAVATAMLAAGAPYFGKQIKDEEVDVTKPLPTGRVIVGTPEVVESPKPKEK